MSSDPAQNTDASRAFWREVVTSGGYTPIPRWTAGQVPGVAEHGTDLPTHTMTAVQNLADELSVSLNSVLLAAHAKVLATLCGEQQVITGYVGEPGGRALPCPLTIEPGSWRMALLASDRVEKKLNSHKAFPVEKLTRELGRDELLFETVLDPTGAGGELEPGTVLRVGLGHQPGQATLRLRYRTDVLDEAAAARIAGYHLRVLALIVDDVDAGHAQQSLLSTAELSLQLEALAGPHRELPDLRAHELFEQRVTAHPDVVAAVHGDLEWTYAELNARANQLARALVARGSGREDVVAVVTERNLDWMAAVLAIFKAGGVYLPIEPHFPADRIRTTLSRAGCRWVLTESASSTTLDEALTSLPGTESLLVDTAYAEDHCDSDLGIEVLPDQLAYIYFTSGSTGQPKGAMCEHRGMLNHLLAKIDDLEISAGQVVAQTAPQCFDISLWQLVSTLLVGGRTQLVEQERILDIERFVDKIIHGKVAVLQVVPSYLEVVLTYLDTHPRELPDLRCVSVTGEALKKELTQRWFAARPGIKLINAYGLTETSDDTNHEVMEQVPVRERVPLGRPINNVRIYIVDEYLAPVPLGAPGEIVFSGVCVGRGYVNDPERTRLAFMTDPHRENSRLYRSGDFGRWLPEGTLEFLGRRDSQVKISGFRIEIGEIENALLQVPGVRDAAVVVTQTDQSKHLVGFYCSHAPLEIAAVRDRLAEKLPSYMVPSVLHPLDALPLTANSKIDMSTLTALAGRLNVLESPDDVSHALSTPSERRLAGSWAKVLGTAPEQIGRLDHFFDSGGTSLTAVRLVIALERAVSLQDVNRHPVLADLACLLDRSDQAPSEAPPEVSLSDREKAGADHAARV